MTRRGDDAAERRALTDAMARLLTSPPTSPRGASSVSGLAKEAGYGRHVLTHKHTDLQDLWVLITTHLTPDATHSTGDHEQTSDIKALKEEVRRSHDINTSLTAQLAAAILRVEELERAGRRGRGAHLRSLD